KRNSNSSSFLLASFKMSISNPKIRFVPFTDRVGSRTLFVDVLLFSFQGSFVGCSYREELYQYNIYHLSSQVLFLK
ncbi:hypothetical protein, partial [Sporosarcina highlanderae]